MTSSKKPETGTEISSSPLPIMKTLSPPNYTSLKPRPKEGGVPIVSKKHKNKSLRSTTTSHSAPTRIQPSFNAPVPPTPSHRPSPSPLDPPMFQLEGSPGSSLGLLPKAKNKKEVKLSQSAPVRVGVALSSSFRDEDLSDIEKIDSPVASSPTIFSILQRDSGSGPSTHYVKSSHAKSGRGYTRGLRPEKQTHSSSTLSSSPSSSSSSTSEDLQFKMESDLDTIKEHQDEMAFRLE
jgi:hypothetical protein